MLRTITLFLLAIFTTTSFAATGGPDTYGYIWKDSNEPDGPVYEWIDITGTGQPVFGLGDDNIVGPYTMETDHPYYWYGRKNVWIGSNGYIAFNAGNIASPFPTIPLAGGVNDYIAAMMADLTFAGDGNLSQCWFHDLLDRTIISYINVPFWTATAPGYTGNNTFQIILDKNDSTITIQYQEQTGSTNVNDLLIGIESVAGSIGLQHSNDAYPVASFAIRFYLPALTELEINDATVNWNSAPGNGGLFIPRNGPAFPLVTNVANTGNTDLFDVGVASDVRNANGIVQVSASATVPLVLASLDTDIPLNAEFVPATTGTYSFTTTVSGVPDELVADNNSRMQEFVVLDTTLAEHDLRFTSAFDDGLGLSWDGGNGGVAMHLVPPYYPAYASATTVRLVSNAGLSGFAMKVYDDDGPNGTAGTLLDSVDVPANDALAGDLVIPLSELLTLTSGGVYVLWYMNGPNVNIAQDITGPFSLRTFEVLGNTWAEYRDRENVDFHIGLRLMQEPVYDISCTGFFAIAPGQEIIAPISVRSWITNLGNQPASGFPMSYRFGTGNIVTQTYDGAAVQPGEQVLFTFDQVFDPGVTAVDELCSWSSWPQDIDPTNDTTCVSVNAFVGLHELDAIKALTWPNPTSTDLWIDGLPLGTFVITLSDAQGRTVVLEQRNASGTPLCIDLRSLADGVHQLQAAGAAGVFRTSVIVQR